MNAQCSWPHTRPSPRCSEDAVPAHALPAAAGSVVPVRFRVLPGRGALAICAQTSGTIHPKGSVTAPARAVAVRSPDRPQTRVPALERSLAVAWLGISARARLRGVVVVVPRFDDISSPRLPRNYRQPPADWSAETAAARHRQGCSYLPRSGSGLLALLRSLSCSPAQPPRTARRKGQTLPTPPRAFPSLRGKATAPHPTFLPSFLSICKSLRTMPKTPQHHYASARHLSCQGVSPPAPPIAHF